jgi:hypothetical protein
LSREKLRAIGESSAPSNASSGGGDAPRPRRQVRILRKLQVLVLFRLAFRAPEARRAARRPI